MQEISFTRGLAAVIFGALCLIADFPLGPCGCLFCLLVAAYFFGRAGPAPSTGQYT